MPVTRGNKMKNIGEWRHIFYDRMYFHGSNKPFRTWLNSTRDSTIFPRFTDSTSTSEMPNKVYMIKKSGLHSQGPDEEATVTIYNRIMGKNKIPKYKSFGDYEIVIQFVMNQTHNQRRAGILIFRGPPNGVRPRFSRHSPNCGCPEVNEVPELRQTQG